MAGTERGSNRVIPARQRIESVSLEGLVVLKIIQHCQEEGAEGDVVQGVLLGLVEGNKLEITNCFPFSQNSEENDEEDIGYQIEMMRHLRSVNIDHLHVGWYQSTYLGAFVNKNLLESQYSYQNSIAESVVLVYDPLKTSQGILSFKALRLSQKMMHLFADKEFTPNSLTKAGMKHDEMFEEIPLVIKNSNLVNTLLCKLDENLTEPEHKDFLSLARGNFIEKNVQLLMETVDELAQDTNKFHNHQRNSARQQQQKDAHLAKRKSENQARKERGERPLPEDDILKMFKPLPVPSRLENLLLSGQADNYCKEINEFASQSFAKLFLSEALQDAQ
ncbi:eukaryotic translation initiation factor 3 subunit H-like [Xenia sp. Carnegie-2017]|uniref:eukaryotic translation initiation factor 3 subunit H-like n=1 Tax=Xenia sp. Carnegie-2017 TaxID=2897299 RepID=UPI001F04DAA1|nr:eukaryotic translation initiation factor 3 subunit H-like [Xenia sp. Carnegie-2017]